MSVRHYPITTVLVDGNPVPIDQTRLVADSPLDLHLPPTYGNLSGADANVQLTTGRGVTDRADTIWSGSTVREGQPVTVAVDDVRVFTGVVDQVAMDLRGFSTSLSCVDQLAGYDTNFSAPATLRRLAARPGSSQRVPTGSNMLFYVDAAFEALGAHSTVQVAGRTDLHVPMVGTAHPYRGDINLLTQRDGTTDSALVPWVEPEWVPMAGGRIGMKNGWGDWTSRPRGHGDPTVGSWHLSVEIDPEQFEDTSYVRVRGLTSEGGFGLWFNAASICQVVTWDNAGNRFTIQHSGSLTNVGLFDLTKGYAHRLLLVYNTQNGALELLRMWEDGTVDATPLVFLTSGSTTPTNLDLHEKQVRLRVTGTCVFGAASLMSRATAISALGNNRFPVPRTVQYDLSTSQIARWSLAGHPPVQNEPAVAFINKWTALRRTFLYPDEFGCFHIQDFSNWPFMSVVHNITDGIVTGDVDLDNLQLSIQRRRRYSRVRVNGQSVVSQTNWGPGTAPKQIYAAAQREITLVHDSDPVELWFEPGDDMFWAEPPYLNFRYAGATPSQPWHLPDDLARGRGSWWGGHVRKRESTEYGHRWATSADVTYTVEQVGASAVKIVMSPGPGLASDEEFVNLPHPGSTGLAEQNPSKLYQHLPVLRGPATATYGEVTGTSLDLGYDIDGWGEHTEYVTDVGLLAVNTGRAEILAQLLADSHTQDFGQATVHCELDPTVRLGQRVRIHPRSKADIVLDGVVTGRTLSLGTGAPSMQLKVWVLSVMGTGDDQFAPAYAALAHSGLSWAGL